MAKTQSIKAQIMARLLSLVEGLISRADPLPPGRVRGVQRALDPNANCGRMPWVYIFDGEEQQTERDTVGKTFEFPVAIKLLLESQDLSGAKDEFVPALQALLESDPQLGTLCNIVDGFTETPFLNETNKPLGGSLLFATIQYRRRHGDPYNTY